MPQIDAIPVVVRVFGLCAALLAAGGTLPASARSATNLSTLDLQLQPRDVAPPELLESGIGDAPVSAGSQNLPEVVREVDQAQRTEPPKRRLPGSGPLDSVTGDQGVLKDLLENKTIPLFRVTVEPPF